MDLIKMCSPDIIDLTEQMAALESKKMEYIKSKILSGECDEQLINMAKNHLASAIAILTSIKDDDFSMEESYDNNENSLSGCDTVFEVLSEIFNEVQAQLVYSYFTRADISVYEINENAFLCITNNNHAEEYVIVGLFDYYEETNDYNTTCIYSVSKHYAYIYEYFVALIKANVSDIWGGFRETYEKFEEEERKEIVF